MGTVERNADVGCLELSACSATFMVMQLSPRLSRGLRSAQATVPKSLSLTLAAVTAARSRAD
jgi:hypothetical protein